MIIERWFNLWCISIHILHLRVMNCIFSLLKTKSIVVNWLWALRVMMSDFNNNFSLAFVIMFSRVSVIVWWMKHLHLSQWEWCRLKSSMISCLQSFLSSSFKREMIENLSVNVVNIEHELKTFKSLSVCVSLSALRVNILIEQMSDSAVFTIHWLNLKHLLMYMHVLN